MGSYQIFCGEEMKEIFRNFVGAMPDFEKREKNFFFNLMMSLFKVPAPNGFHWILYSAYRDTALISLTFAFIVIARLYPHADMLTEKLVATELRFFTVGMSVPILLGIIPFYYFKVRYIFEFSKMDFIEIFFVKASKSEATIKLVMSRAVFSTLLLCFCLIFSWIILSIILKHYNLITSLFSISVFLAIYSFLISPFLSFCIVLILTIYSQYKRNSREIPAQKTHSKKE